MKIDIQKHRVLRELAKVKLNNPQYSRDSALGEISASRSLNFLMEKTKIKEDRLRYILRSLAVGEEVVMGPATAKNEHANFRITDLGEKTYYQHIYVSKFWEKVIPISALLLSLLTILLSIHDKVVDSSQDSLIEYRISTLEKYFK